MKLKTTIEFFKDMQADIREMEYSDANEAAVMNSLSEGYFKDAIDALEKSKKYRWHDLRKDPKDLPNKGGIYIVCIEYPTGEKEIGMGYYKNMYGYRGVWSPLMPNDGKVIAWREIEPFEENEV